MSVESEADRSAFWRHLPGIRLTHDLAVLNDEGVGTHLTRIVGRLCRPRHEGILTLHGRTGHLKGDTLLAEFLEEGGEESADLVEALHVAIRREDDGVLGIVRDDAIEIAFAKTGQVMIEHLFEGGRR